MEVTVGVSLLFHKPRGHPCDDQAKLKGDILFSKFLMRRGLFLHSLRAFSGVIYASEKMLAEVAPGVLAQNVGAH